MNRLTRSLALVNSPESHPFIVFLRRGSPPVARSLAGVFSAETRSFPSQFSKPKIRKRTFFAATSRRRGPDKILTAMDTDADSSRQPTPEFGDSVAASEDFINIEGPASPVHEEPIENLVQSISSVDEDRGDERSEDAGAGEGDQRKVLPEELCRSVMKLSCESLAEGGICDVYLVGTAHVSQESCQEVQAVINYLKPEAVFLELCSSRVAVLTPQNLKVPTMTEMVEMWKKQHNIFGILYSWFLAKVANKLEVFPGSEFRVAFEEAVKYGGKVILGDRPVQITLRRTWGKMPLWHKTKLLYSLVFQAFFLPSPEELNRMLKDMDDVDMLTLVIQEMSKEFPTLMETLVHERDQYMSSTLLRVAREHSLVVAVVGKGHLQGIKKNWMQPVEVKNLLELDVSSEKKALSPMKVLKTLGVAVAGMAIISGIYLSTKK